MRFLSLRATTHPAGNRIDLAWQFPAPADFPGVRVVRREGSHPTTPEDGVVVAHDLGIESAVDTGLKGEAVYYYALFGFEGDPPAYDVDRHNRASALATSPHDHAGQMYALLPGVYHRYDTRLSDDAALSTLDRGRGQLRRFLDLPGAQLDLLRGFARAALDLHDIERIDGVLLPMLAQWVGWKTDTQREIETQRNELRHAPYLYRSIGLKPTIEATAKRITDWESRSKEFVHNVFRSNNPERLNLWLQQRSGGTWTAAEMLSLDFAYEGRAAAARTGDQTLWLLYHTLRNGRWEIWQKRHDPLSGWLPSAPLPSSAHSSKYPTACLEGGAPWVIWNELDETTQTWRLAASLWDGTRWSASPALPATGADARRPLTFTDDSDTSNPRAWLFWLEKVGSSALQLKYSRRDGATWGAPVAFPLDGGADPRVEADPYVLFDPAGARIWLFWSRAIDIGAGQTRAEIAYRVKSDANFDAANWSAVRTLPKPAGADYHDRQPAALLDAGSLELYWSSNRGPQGNAIWRSRLTNPSTNTWEAAERVTTGPYAHRDPLPIAAGGDLWLLFRANRSIAYQSEVYEATRSVDFRYAGSTTADARHADKHALHGAFEDFQTYTYDAGTDGKRDDTNWYARDTIGVYLATDTLDPARVEAGTGRLRKVLREFMPITDRAVLFANVDRHDDYVYTYSTPGATAPLFIAETYADALTTLAEEAALGPGEDFSDALG